MLLAGVIKGMKVLKKGQSMLESLDDDINADGKPDLDELKAVLEEVKVAGKNLFELLKKAYEICLRIYKHVKEAGQ
jgi:hypothetical protein